MIIIYWASQSAEKIEYAFATVLNPQLTGENIFVWLGFGNLFTTYALEMYGIDYRIAKNGSNLE